METYSLTDIGQTREMNQDYFFSSEEPVGNLPTLFIVADGMGGHKAGEFASCFTVEKVVEAVTGSKKEDIPEILGDAIRNANLALIEYAGEHPQMHGMGTTVVAAVVTENQLYVANVGDSRLYIVGKNSRQVTRDHSLVQEMVRIGELDETQARSHPDKNIITRAIGADKNLKIDVFEEQIEPGDKILLCTDGLTNMLEDTAIFEILNDARSGLSEKVEQLVRQANENGGTDNITVVEYQPMDEVAE